MVKVRIDEEVIVGGAGSLPGTLYEVGAKVELDDDDARTLVEHRMATVIGGKLPPATNADPTPST